MYYLFDPRYLLFMAPAFLLMMAAQIYVSSSFSKWSRVAARGRMTGAQAANHLIRRFGLSDVRVEGVGGKLTDHYDPRSKILRLSAGVYQQPSVAALAIAAHELGHAMQDQEGYAPLKLRAAMVPVVNIGSYLGWILIIIGLALGAAGTGLAWLGVLVFSGGLLFALVTLPVEIDASRRAKAMLAETGLILGEDEQGGVNAVLNAAALTYIAAMVTAALQLLYYVMLIAGGGRRRD